MRTKISFPSLALLTLLAAAPVGLAAQSVLVEAKTTAGDEVATIRTDSMRLLVPLHLLVGGLLFPDGTLQTTAAAGLASVTSAQIVDGTIVDADISASAAIADTKLGTITSAGKVANSATTATSANTASAIVARDAAGGFQASFVQVGDSLRVRGEGSFLATGTYEESTTVPSPVSGAGTRMMWYPQKAAFRAGRVTGTQWAPINIGDHSIAAGLNTIASGLASTAFGSNTAASGNRSTALGFTANASGESSTAFGYSTSASGDYSTASGSNSVASGRGSTALGEGSNAGGDYATAAGYSSIASGGSTALGFNATASGSYSTALGFATTAGGSYSTAFGYHTTASGNLATALGDQTTASGQYSTASGHGTMASGQASVALGYNANAIGDYSVALGSGATASGNNTTAFGSGTASGVLSTAFGVGTAASGSQSTALGSNTTASGNYSTALGSVTTASGMYSTAVGIRATAQPYGSVAIGRYNIVTGTADSWVATEPLFVAGNGTSTQFSNALTLYKNGDLTIAGTLTQNSDARLKEGIEPLESTLERVLRLMPIRYHFRTGMGRPAGTQIGLTAQQVQPLFPELVKQDGDGYLSLSYANLSAVLVKAVQEQQAEIRTLRQRLESAEARVSRLEALVKELVAGRTTSTAGPTLPDTPR